MIAALTAKEQSRILPLMERILFVSAADRAFYPLLREWLHSIRRHPQSKDMNIAIMDVGLTEEQRQSLTPLVTTIVKPDWPIHLPAHKTKGLDHVKACVNRPFLPKIFPGYDIYFWMDADTWVQDWRGVDLFLQGARKNRIALTAQVDRAYAKSVRLKWLGNWPFKPRGFYYSNAKQSFNRKIAKTLFSKHLLLAGAFCLHKDAPHWEAWQKLIQTAMQKGRLFCAEQLSLGVLVHIEGYEAEMLPAWAHWLNDVKPLWDPQREIFVEPFLPHETIGIMHLFAYKEMRTDRTLTTNFKALDGRKIALSYRYPHLDGDI